MKIKDYHCSVVWAWPSLFVGYVRPEATIHVIGLAIAHVFIKKDIDRDLSRPVTKLLDDINYVYMVMVQGEFAPAIIQGKATLVGFSTEAEALEMANKYMRCPFQIQKITVQEFLECGFRYNLDSQGIYSNKIGGTEFYQVRKLSDPIKVDDIA